VSQSKPCTQGEVGLCFVEQLNYNFLVYYTYLLQLNNGNYYAGYSTNLKHRYEQHKLGHIRATKNFLPIKLVFYAAFISKKRALDFEKYLKTNSGFAFRNKRLIEI